MLPPINNNPVICGYPSSSMYPTSSGEGVTVWPNDSYPSVRSLSYDEDHRPWLAEQEQGYCSRDRRPECRPPLHLHSTQNHFPSSYIPPSDLVPSHSTFQSSYSRASHEVHSPLPSWDSWDLPVDSNTSLSHVRRYEEKPSWSNSLPPVASMDPHSFDNIMFPSPDSSSSSAGYTPPPEPSIPLNGFNFPHRMSPIPSPTPSPVQEDVKPIIHAISTSSPYSRRRPSGEGSESGKSCSHCHATTTPLWRRDPSTMKPLCNACGLYLQQRNKLRPQELIDADDDGSSSEESDANYVGPECSHCRTHRTSVWRRSKTGEQLCNACGVYARLRGKPRPLSLKKNKIRPRSKHSPK
jgi:Zn ribbon nucleic-acid-binding protein